jgi:hypothetical protein
MSKTAAMNVLLSAAIWAANWVSTFFASAFNFGRSSSNAMLDAIRLRLTLFREAWK